MSKTQKTSSLDQRDSKEVHIPNDKTLQAMKEAMALEGEYTTLDELKREGDALSH